MRSSRPMPRATSVTSAPISSQTLAISLMKLILVARKALEASLIISALETSVRTIGASERLVDRRDRVAPPTRRSASAPITTRSGSMKSLTAVPSRRNSGQET